MVRKMPAKKRNKKKENEKSDQNLEGTVNLVNAG
jgi:hypothetical protein